MSTPKGNNPAQRRYPPEIKERAVRMVQARRREDPLTRACSPGWPASSASSRDPAPLGATGRGRRGPAPGSAGKERARIADLEREVKELRRSNEILKAASIFFAAELDRPQAK